MKQERKFFTKIKDATPLPDLIELQKSSYKWLFDEGLSDLFNEISPIKDFIGRDLELSFGEYALDKPKFDEILAKERNVTHEASLRVKIKLLNKKTKEVQEQEVFLGDFPLMTDRGTFIINGVERVVVSQLIRSPGIFFTTVKQVGDFSLYGAKIIPNRGAWLELESGKNGVIWVRIDRKRKVAATSLLRAFGYGSDEAISNLFKGLDEDSLEYINNTIKKDLSSSEDEGMLEVYKKIRPGDLATVDNAKSLIHAMFFNFDRYDFGRAGRYKIEKRLGLKFEDNKEGRVLKVEDIVASMKEIIRLNLTQEASDDIDHLSNRRVRGVGELLQNRLRIGMARMERIVKDRMSTSNVKVLTPGQLINARPVDGVIKEFFMTSQLSQFMDQTNPLAELAHKRRLSVLGPGGLNRERAGFEVRDVHTTYYGRICPIATSEGPNIGLVGHMSTYAKIDEYGFLKTPYRKIISQVENKPDLITGKVAGSDIKKGGSVIVKAGEIITKELAQKITKLDLLKIAVKPMVSKEIVYLDAAEEGQSVTTPATTVFDDEGYIVREKVEARINGEPGIIEASQVDYMDVSTKQILSVTTSLIPFLEHDDAVRALMGTNMQRQAVPCIKPQAPLVGTGIEEKAARDSGHVVLAIEDGKVSAVSANKIEVAQKDGKVKKYRLNKFIRSNASTCLNQKPIVNVDEMVKKGQPLADGPSTDNGELAIGQNILVAFMPWRGWNYEDAIIVSNRIIKEDRLTSVYIETYPVDIRETKLGPEVVTRDIPNISEERLKDLDEDGIIRVGAEVSSGDILVGKITPKGETELSAEEKLLRAIFGEKAKDVRDSSLYLKHGDRGKVIDVKIFSREQGDKLSTGVIKTVQITIASLRKVQVGDKMSGRHGNKGIISKIVPIEDMPYMEDGTPVDIILSPLGVPSRMNIGQILEVHMGMAAKKNGYTVATPVFNGIPESTIKEELQKAGIDSDGKSVLHDGITGDKFKNKVTVGYMYMLKLNHMVEDKMHQRSIGPYSLITQQPLGGKAQHGGQRFGEMEVWALEGYGAAYALQEMLTIKSDDVPGRAKAYESIVKGEPIENIGLPESFNILVRELNGLGLKVDLFSDGKEVKRISAGEDKSETHNS
jgi:DNA-directed RNA polymerase subunit beta